MGHLVELGHHRIAAVRGPAPYWSANRRDRAVARFAFLLGHRSVVFVPTGVHPSAVDAIRAEGADVHEVDGDYDAAIAGAAELADSAGGLLVQDMAWPGYSTVPGWIVDGYHTMFVELDAQLAALGVERPDLVVVPTGVGSLLQAALTHYRCDPERAATRVASVEPDTAACVHASRAYCVVPGPGSRSLPTSSASTRASASSR